MAKADTGATSGVFTATSAGESLHALNIGSIVSGLVKDLEELRAGRLTIQQAHAHAKLAHEILRGINFVITAQKYLDAKPLALPAGGDRPKARGRRKTIDGEAHHG